MCIFLLLLPREGKELLGLLAVTSGAFFLYKLGGPQSQAQGLSLPFKRYPMELEPGATDRSTGFQTRLCQFSYVWGQNNLFPLLSA